MAKKNLLFTFICAIFVSLLAACAGKSAAPSSVSFIDHVPARPDSESDYPLEPTGGKTASEYLRDEKITCGWVLGNSLDAHIDGIPGEALWGNPMITQELMNGVKAAGFDIIRIPVTWLGEIGQGPDYRITRNQLIRVAEVVGMAHNAGLKAIINLHHDGQTGSGGKDIGWLSLNKAGRNMDEFNRITAQYVRVWKQIAVYFKNYGDWLIFESFNELHDGNWQSGNNPAHFIILNRWNQFFVDTVRSTGGNNGTRYLMLAAYCSDYRTALSAGFMLPNDPAPDRLIVTFHYYDPYELGIQGSRSFWGSADDRQKVEKDFAPFKERFIEKNIPVIMGECGAVLQLYSDQTRTAQARQSRLDYVSHVFGTAKKYGLIPLYWDNGLTAGNGEKFGLLNRRTGQPNSPESDTLIKQMINAVK